MRNSIGPIIAHFDLYYYYFIKLDVLNVAIKIIYIFVLLFKSICHSKELFLSNDQISI